MDDARNRLSAEQQFIDERGGRRWIEDFVKPYYMTMQSLPPNGEVGIASLLPTLRMRAFELSLDDIAWMVRMQWRLQVVGAWYAIARCEPSLSASIHRGFEFCGGTLTAPSLTVAVLTYPSDTTASVLGRYRDRDLANKYGASAFIDAALRRLDGQQPNSSEGDRLDQLLSRAQALQSMSS